MKYDPEGPGYRYLSWVSEQGLWHAGRDYNFGVGNQDLGQDVLCPTWARVLYVSSVGENGGLGLYVLLQHPHNNAFTRYMHLQDSSVLAGQILSPGQIFAHVGKRGTRSSHLHFEVLNDKGLQFIMNSARPYGRYTKGLTKAQVQSMWIDPDHWLTTQEHYVGKDAEQRLSQVENALKWAVPPRRNMLLRLAERLKKADHVV